MDAPRIASNQWTTYEKHAQWSLNVCFTSSDLELYRMTLSGLCLEGISILSCVVYDYPLFKNCLENVVVIVHALTDHKLSKWPWGILFLQINNLKSCWNLASFFWVTLTFEKLPWVNFVWNQLHVGCFCMTYDQYLYTQTLLKRETSSFLSLYTK
jgi:hypothetical protein